MHFSRFTIACVSSFISLFGSVSVAGTLPAAPRENWDQTVGYFPTYEETDIITSADYDYPRSSGGPLYGPDLDRWAATGGIWPYEYQDGGLTRLQRFMQPVDYILRPLTPGETIATQGPLSNSWFQVAGSMPFLSRTYHPERSTMTDIFGNEAAKYSPLFFDVLALSAIGIYVDGSGEGFGEEGLEDGFLAGIGIDLRAGWAITDRTSLLLAGKLYFVLSPDFDFQVYADAGAMSALASINFQFEWGAWDFRIYDDLIPFSSRHLLYDESYQGDEFQQRGHYYVGIPKIAETGDWWNSREHYLVNTAGATAGAFVSDSVRFVAGFARVDTWLWNDFDQHSPSEYLTAGLFYDGYDLWVAPSVTYTLGTHDFEDPGQTVMVNGVAPLSPNTTVYGGFGYYWGSAFEGYNWNIGIQNRPPFIGDRFMHSLTFSSGYHDAVVGDDFIGNKVAYQVNYQMGPRITLSGIVGWYEGAGETTDAFNLGAYATFALGNYTSLQLLGAYYDTDTYQNIRGASGESWLYSVTLARRLAERLNGELSYEYVDSGAGLYQESAILVRLTRTF